jgi:hypothetical protein
LQHANKEYRVAADQTVSSPFTVSFSRTGGAAVIARLQIWDTSKSPFACVDHEDFTNQAINPDSRTVTLPVGKYIGVFDSSGTPNLNGSYTFVFTVNAVVVDTASGDCAATTGSADRHDQFNLIVTARAAQ